MSKNGVERRPPNNVQTIRDGLYDTFNDLRNDRITPAAANAIANQAGKIFASIRLQLDYAKAVGSRPSVPELDPGEKP